MPDSGAGGRLTEARLAIAFLTRLPVGQIADPPPLGRASWAFPLAGALAALVPAAVFASAFAVLPPPIAAFLALAAGMLVTGALHEDGLADIADGFGGGRTRQRKLEIMRDSRIGSYGALALVLSVALRAAALAGAPDAAAGALALVLNGAASRAVLPAMMAVLPSARVDGLAVGAGVPPPVSWLVALGSGAVALAFLPRPVLSLLALLAATLAVSLLAWRQIGGQTGDSLGATQQAGELALWLVLAAWWR